jgi:hypothetical protein
MIIYAVVFVLNLIPYIVLVLQGRYVIVLPCHGNVKAFKHIKEHKMNEISLLSCLAFFICGFLIRYNIQFGPVAFVYFFFLNITEGWPMITYIFYGIIIFYIYLLYNQMFKSTDIKKIENFVGDIDIKKIDDMINEVRKIIR